MNSPLNAAAPGINATVLASAGTGKTWLLVTRLVRLLLVGARPDSILAITFTRKAAAEMQSRLEQRLAEMATLAPDDLEKLFVELGVDSQPETMERARSLYEQLLRTPLSVKTTTFHAFCQSILRRFPLEADVPPGFELAEQSGDLMQIAWQALISECTADPGGPVGKIIASLLNSCGGQHNLYAALMEFVSFRSDWWAYSAGVSNPIRSALEQLSLQLGVSTGSPFEMLLQPVTENALGVLVAEMRHHKTKTFLGYLEILSGARDNSVPIEHRYQLLCTVLQTKEGLPRSQGFTPSAALEKSLGSDGLLRFTESRDLLLEQLDHCREQLLARQALQLNHAWYHGGVRLLEYYQRVKLERRTLDFTDLEWRTYQLLTQGDNAQWVQFKLDQRIDHLLVDEFQDTNPTQWRLLLPLLEEMAAGSPERGRSIFLVGDTKQSIYRFRRADPRLLPLANQWLEQSMAAISIQQHHSWRSSPAIIEFVNRLFHHPDLAVLVDDFETHDTHLKGLWGSVSLLPLIEDEVVVSPPMPDGQENTLRNPLQTARHSNEEQRFFREGQLIATEIERLIKNAIPVGSPQQSRPMRYSDVMVLVRNRTHVAHYERALRESKIPFIGAERGTLLESQEIDDLLALLEYLLTPYNNLKLAQLLRSPIFSCCDHHLLTLAEQNRAEESWLDTLKRLDNDGLLPPELTTTVQLLMAWQQQVDRLPIHDLLDRIYKETNLLQRYRAAYPAHLASRAEANLLRFLELALEIDAGRYPSLTRFLTRLEQLRLHSGEAPDEAPALGEGDRVRIITIHSAKGLESPVVFLADTTSSPSSHRAFRALVNWPTHADRPETLQLVGKQQDLPAFTQRALKADQQAEQRESANLLYVAVTRARQHLYISGCHPRRGNDLGWYRLLNESLTVDGTPNDVTTYAVHHGTPPPLTQAVPPAKVPQLRVDPQLLAPFVTQSPAIEIAPSHAGNDEEWLSGGSEEGQLRGVIIHRFLELMGKTRPLDARSALRQVAGEQRLIESQPLLTEALQEATELLMAPQYRDLFTPVHGVTFMTEVPLSYRQAGGRVVYGLIDRLRISPTEILVIDYKSHRGVTAHSIEQYAAPYEEQMRYYVTGVQRLWPERRVRAIVLFTAGPFHHEFSLEELRSHP